MDFMNRGGAQPQVRPSQPAATDEQPKNESHNNKNKAKLPLWMRILSLGLLVCGALLIVAVLVFVVFAKDNSELSQIKTDKYQAVFLNTSDGQVYFGKLSVLNKSYYKLTDIYYVRVNQVQPSDPKQSPQQQISLAKLGSEIHGPEDAMFINKKDVIFWENLKDDGQVVKAIKDYKEKGETTDSSNDTNTNNNTNTQNTTTNP